MFTLDSPVIPDGCVETIMEDHNNRPGGAIYLASQMLYIENKTRRELVC
jgi:hypothetical protein